MLVNLVRTGRERPVAIDAQDDHRKQKKTCVVRIPFRRRFHLWTGITGIANVQYSMILHYIAAACATRVGARRGKLTSMVCKGK